MNKLELDIEADRRVKVEKSGSEDNGLVAVLTITLDDETLLKPDNKISLIPGLRFWASYNWIESDEPSIVALGK